MACPCCDLRTCNDCCKLPCGDGAGASNCGSLYVDIEISATASSVTTGTLDTAINDCPTVTVGVPASSTIARAGNAGCLWSRGSANNPISIPRVPSDPNAGSLPGSVLPYAWDDGISVNHYGAAHGSVSILKSPNNPCVARMTFSVLAWGIEVTRFHGVYPTLYFGEPAFLAHGREQTGMLAVQGQSFTRDVEFTCVSELVGQSLSVSGSFPRRISANGTPGSDNLIELTSNRCRNRSRWSPQTTNNQNFFEAEDASLLMTIASISLLP